MKMKLSEILVLNNTLKSIIDSDQDLKMDPLFKFKLLGILKKLEDPITNFDVIRNDKIKEYGDKDDKGNITISQDDHETMKKFTEDLNKVLASDVEVNIEKLKAEVVFGAGIPTDYLVKLYSIMEE